MKNVRGVNHENSKSFNNVDIFILDKLDRTVYNRFFDNTLPSFVDISSYLIYNFLY